MTHRTAASFTPQTTRHALRAACATAGVSDAGARLMRLGENALYHLADQGVVVRVARTMDYWSTAVKEVQVARWLASCGVRAATLADCIEQPVEANGHPVTFWKFIDGSVAMPEDIALLGQALHEIHDLPSPDSFTLPRLDSLSRVEPRVKKAPISTEDKDLFLGRCHKLRDDIQNLSYPLSPTNIHGDAHIKNLMLAEGESVIIDFEGFAYGQPEWDLSMTATEYITAGWWTDEQYAEFVAAYGFDVTQWSGFSTLKETQEIKMTTWVMQNADHSAEVRAEFDARVHTIRTGEVATEWRPL